MIKKVYRLREREVKKVLQKWKPFFSYNIVVNYTQNRCHHNRFAIVIGKKSIFNNVQRTFFRRRFYDMVSKYCENTSVEKKKYFDVVFVVKKQTKLDKKSETSIRAFEKDILFLAQKIHL